MSKHVLTIMTSSLFYNAKLKTERHYYTKVIYFSVFKFMFFSSKPLKKAMYFEASVYVYGKKRSQQNFSSVCVSNMCCIQDDGKIYFRKDDCRTVGLGIYYWHSANIEFGPKLG